MTTGILFIIGSAQSIRCGSAQERIIRALSPEKYKIFLCLKEQQGLDWDLPLNVKLAPFDYPWRFNPLLILKLMSFIKRNNISIVHGIGTTSDLYGASAARFSGHAKYISTIELPKVEADAGHPQKKNPGFFERLSARFAHRFIAPADTLGKKAIRERKINADKVITIHMGIDVAKYRIDMEARRRIRAELFINDKVVLIGAFGKLIWQNGFEFLIKAMPMVLRSYPDSKVLIVGDGPFRENLIMHSDMIHVAEHLVLAGVRDDMKEVLSAIDILVVPSLVEDFPVITLEGMAMAKPVVSSRIDGIEEQIDDGETGMLVPSWDANAIARAINRLINDRAFAENLGMKAREKVEKDFSVEKMISETQKIYDSL
jgi:glycosyltransferase involved in cell wall biosynthesis